MVGPLETWMQTVVDFVGVNAVLQAALLFVFFWVLRKGNRTSNRILAALLLVFGILIFSLLPGASYSFGRFAKVAFLTRRAAFLIAPLFYFYIKSSVDRRFRFRPADALHLIPFAVLSGLTVYQAFILHVWRLPLLGEYRVHTSMILVHNAIYILLALRHLKSRNASLKGILRESGGVYWKWLKFFIVGYSVFWIINFHNLFLMNILKITQWCPYATSVTCLIPFLFFNAIALVALLKPEVFAQKNPNGEAVLDEAMVLRVKARLLADMEARRPYLRTDLSLGDLAGDLAISVKHLSFVINSTLRSNFYDFINRYRIDHSKRLLDEAGDRTILQIAYDVGFNSKSTFNSAFKKQTGLTPSEYRRRSGGRSRLDAAA